MSVVSVTICDNCGKEIPLEQRVWNLVTDERGYDLHDAKCVLEIVKRLVKEAK